MLKNDLSSYLIQKTTEKRILISCHLDLTYHCNLNCIHCYVVKENRKEMKTSKIVDIIDQLAALGTLYLSLSGGEVLTREDFFEIAEYARDMHFALNISTNGTLIDEEIANKLSNLNLHQIFISIYSMNPKIHDKITGISGSLEKTIDAVKMIKRNDMPLSISNTIMKQNVNEYYQVYEMAKKLDAEIRFDPQITPKTDGDKLPLINQIGKSDLQNILSDPLLKLNLRNEPAEYMDNNITDLPCGAAHTTCYISPYGDIFPCVQFPLLCGNINENQLHEIWYNSSNMLDASNIRMSNLPVCSKCEIIDYCHYCPGLSILEEDDIKIPPDRCCAEAELLFSLGGEIYEKNIPETSNKNRKNV